MLSTLIVLTLAMPELSHWRPIASISPQSHGGDEEDERFADWIIFMIHSEKCMDFYHKPSDTQRCLPYSTSHTKHCLKNVPFVMVRSMCIIVENNSVKSKYLKELKENFRTYGYL